MDLNYLHAISPIDGRYRNKIAHLSNYFSEAALIKYRLIIEVEYFISLCELPLPQLKDFDKTLYPQLQSLYKDFSENDALRIKEFENITNHDVKAVEYFLKEKFEALNLSKYKEFIHFGLTSQDINNTAIPLLLKEVIHQEYHLSISNLLQQLNTLATQWKDIPMLARTHGQPATPTRLGKEIQVFITRLKQQINTLQNIPFAAKFGGATGNFNAHFVAYPLVDWKSFGANFVENKLGLHYSFPTTQIEHYDHLAALFDNLKRINVILIDLNRDIWQYIAMDYFKQSTKKGEIGSSAMPHKVNPIDFENSEGNLGIANAIFEHLSAKLPISRLQRDLTDSTVLRNIGVPFAHTIIGFKSTLKGLQKLLLNQDKINQDLDHNWAVVTEAIQTILRRESYPNPYETLKDLTTNHQPITKDSIFQFINQLNVSESIKNELKQITPFNYTGI